MSSDSLIKNLLRVLLRRPIERVSVNPMKSLLVVLLRIPIEWEPIENLINCGLSSRGLLDKSYWSVHWMISDSLMKSLWESFVDKFPLSENVIKSGSPKRVSWVSDWRSYRLGLIGNPIEWILEVSSAAYWCSLRVLLKKNPSISPIEWVVATLRRCHWKPTEKSHWVGALMRILLTVDDH